MKSRKLWRVFVTTLVSTVGGCRAGDSVTDSKPGGKGADSKMSYTEITPEQAKKLVESDGYVYLDVRTVPEFVAGHAPDSLNVPVVEINPVTGGRAMNERFLSVVEAAVPKDAKLVVGCKTGGRSATACELLARAGYKNLRNIDGGFAGVTDPTGQVVKEGWSTLGYPVERGEGGSRSYESLRTNAP